MALTGTMMRAYIRRNGHLVLDGTENVSELRMALQFLMPHTWEHCHKRDLGAPIDSLIMDPAVLRARSGKRKNVVSVDLSGERL